MLYKWRRRRNRNYVAKPKKLWSSSLNFIGGAVSSLIDAWYFTTSCHSNDIHFRLSYCLTSYIIIKAMWKRNNYSSLFDGSPIIPLCVLLIDTNGFYALITKCLYLLWNLCNKTILLLYYKHKNLSRSKLRRVTTRNNN